ncbi:MAG: TlpA family protein disulfide reductase [Planctomycetes bacterium]|nr:TlpA family protein disulfide reductase [Planctomycetota bacterium]
MISIDKFLLIKIGDQAPNFSAKSVEGDDVRLEDHRGKVVLVDFWATWCAPCIAEMPNIERIYNEHRNNGTFEVVGVSLDTDERQVKRFVKGKAPWPQIVGGPAENNPIAMKYFVAGIPATFLIDYEGKVVAKDLRGADLRREVRRQVKRARAASSKVTANLDQDGKARIITK